MNEEIVVPVLYTFDPLTKFLRKGGLLVKNIWPKNSGPNQEEINLAIAAMEEAVDMLKK